jgi:hypothetical protein
LKHIVVNKDEHVFQLPLPEVTTFLQKIDRKSKEKRVNITSTDRTFRYLAKISENNEKESESGTHRMRLALVEDPSLVLGSAGGEFLHNLPTILTLDEGDVRRTGQKRRPGRGRRRHGSRYRHRSGAATAVAGTAVAAPCRSRVSEWDWGILAPSISRGPAAHLIYLSVLHITPPITSQSHLAVTPQRKFSDRGSPRQQIRRHTVHSDL